MKTLIFDFDGVFTDSFSVTLSAIQSLHKKYQLPDISKDDLINLFCKNFWDEHKHYGLPKEKEEDFKKELLARVESRQGEISFFPGIQNVMERLTEKGSRMIIISSNKTSSIQNKLATLNLENSFTEILGADKPGNKKEKMSNIIQEIGENDTVFFITDTLGDIREVQSFPLTTVAVTWGYHSQELLEQGNPDYMATHPEELVAILTQ